MLFIVLFNVTIIIYAIIGIIYLSSLLLLFILILEWRKLRRGSLGYLAAV